MCSQVYTVVSGADCSTPRGVAGLGWGWGITVASLTQMLPLWQLNGWGFTRSSSPVKHSDFVRPAASKTAKGDMTGSLQAQP